MIKIRHKWLALLAASVLMGSLAVAAPQPAQALSGSTFDPGYIISDAIFFNSNAMDTAAIQSFLVGTLPTCAQNQGAACLRNYVETTTGRAATARCSAYAGGTNEPASLIINKVAKACGINPQVILATLQKEQGLITNGSPTPGRYTIAMGYGCPDTAACDSLYYGFFNQVYSASSQFIRYAVNPSSWRYHVGNVAIYYNPDASCGSSVVNIRNQATANLYNYTPYQPNAASLANLSGSATCGAYGNRNFWVYFNNWFGSPVGLVNPLASWDISTAAAGTVRLAGWAFDPDSKDPINVAVYIDDVGVNYLASNNRPDLPPIYGDVGTQHGFDVTIPLTSPGPKNVCAYAINVGPGANTFLGCRSMQSPSGSPFGVVDRVTSAAGQISVSGWTFDPDSTSSIPVHIYADAVGQAFVADQSRPDVAAAYQGYGAAHGYSVTFAASPGTHNVCAYGINVAGTGSNTQLGCVSVNVASGSPYGAVDSVYATPGHFVASGWAIDPDTAASIAVHMYSDAAGYPFVADGSRADVGAVYAGYGNNHGYSISIPAWPGTHSVCIYGINSAGPGYNNSLGCTTLTALSGPPVGVVDSASVANGMVTAKGWAFDPDTADSISVRAEIDGVPTTLAANQTRSDLPAVYPQYGAAHGYSFSHSISAGPHRICVFGLNVGNGTDTALGCIAVTS